MDFHSLRRRELQTLCKKQGIPANSTNVEMANSLSDLLKRNPQGVEQILQDRHSHVNDSESILGEISEVNSENVGKMERLTRASRKEKSAQISDSDRDFSTNHNERNSQGVEQILQARHSHVNDSESILGEISEVNSENVGKMEKLTRASRKETSAQISDSDRDFSTNHNAQSCRTRKSVRSNEAKVHSLVEGDSASDASSQLGDNSSITIDSKLDSGSSIDPNDDSSSPADSKVDLNQSLAGQKGREGQIALRRRRASIRTAERPLSNDKVTQKEEEEEEEEEEEVKSSKCGIKSMKSGFTDSKIVLKTCLKVDRNKDEVRKKKCVVTFSDTVEITEIDFSVEEKSPSPVKRNTRRNIHKEVTSDRIKRITRASATQASDEVSLFQRVMPTRRVRRDHGGMDKGNIKSEGISEEPVIKNTSRNLRNRDKDISQTIPYISEGQGSKNDSEPNGRGSTDTIDEDGLYESIPQMRRSRSSILITTEKKSIGFKEIDHSQMAREHQENSSSVTESRRRTRKVIFQVLKPSENPNQDENSVEKQNAMYKKTRKQTIIQEEQKGAHLKRMINEKLDLESQKNHKDVSPVRQSRGKLNDLKLSHTGKMQVEKASKKGTLSKRTRNAINSSPICDTVNDQMQKETGEKSIRYIHEAKNQEMNENGCVDNEGILTKLETIDGRATGKFGKYKNSIQITGLVENQDATEIEYNVHDSSIKESNARVSTQEFKETCQVSELEGSVKIENKVLQEEERSEELKSTLNKSDKSESTFELSCDTEEQFTAEDKTNADILFIEAIKDAKEAENRNPDGIASDSHDVSVSPSSITCNYVHNIAMSSTDSCNEIKSGLSSSNDGLFGCVHMSYTIQAHDRNKNVDMNDLLSGLHYQVLDADENAQSILSKTAGKCDEFEHSIDVCVQMIQPSLKHSIMEIKNTSSFSEKGDAIQDMIEADNLIGNNDTDYSEELCSIPNGNNRQRVKQIENADDIYASDSLVEPPIMVGSEEPTKYVRSHDSKLQSDGIDQELAHQSHDSGTHVQKKSFDFADEFSCEDGSSYENNVDINDNAKHDSYSSEDGEPYTSEISEQSDHKGYFFPKAEDFFENEIEFHDGLPYTESAEDMAINELSVPSALTQGNFKKYINIEDLAEELFDSAAESPEKESACAQTNEEYINHKNKEDSYNNEEGINQTQEIGGDKENGMIRSKESEGNNSAGGDKFTQNEDTKRNSVEINPTNDAANTHQFGMKETEHHVLNGENCESLDLKRSHNDNVEAECETESFPQFVLSCYSISNEINSLAEKPKKFSVGPSNILNDDKLDLGSLRENIAVEEKEQNQSVTMFVNRCPEEKQTSMKVEVILKSEANTEPILEFQQMPQNSQASLESIPTFVDVNRFEQIGKPHLVSDNCIEEISHAEQPHILGNCTADQNSFESGAKIIDRLEVSIITKGEKLAAKYEADQIKEQVVDFDNYTIEIADSEKPEKCGRNLDTCFSESLVGRQQNNIEKEEEEEKKNCNLKTWPIKEREEDLDTTQNLFNHFEGAFLSEDLHTMKIENVDDEVEIKTLQQQSVLEKNATQVKQPILEISKEESMLQIDLTLLSLRKLREMCRNNCKSSQKSSSNETLIKQVKTNTVISAENPTTECAMDPNAVPLSSKRAALKVLSSNTSRISSVGIKTQLANLNTVNNDDRKPVGFVSPLGATMDWDVLC